MHLAGDALGNPVTLHLSPGQDTDISRVETLLADHRPDAVLGDKGYESDKLAAEVERSAAEAVIPPTKNRVAPRAYDKVL